MVKYNILKFKKSSRKNKKYDVYVYIDDKLKKISFGDNRMQQWKDQTPLKLYSHMDHNDPKRRKQYRARASKIKNKKGEYTFNKPEYANYWSYNYLW